MEINNVGKAECQSGARMYRFNMMWTGYFVNSFGTFIFLIEAKLIDVYEIYSVHHWDVVSLVTEMIMIKNGVPCLYSCDLVCI